MVIHKFDTRAEEKLKHGARVNAKRAVGNKSKDLKTLKLRELLQRENEFAATGDAAGEAP